MHQMEVKGTGRVIPISKNPTILKYWILTSPEISFCEAERKGNEELVIMRKEVQLDIISRSMGQAH